MASLMISVLTVTVTAVLIGTTFLYTKLFNQRFKLNAHLPQLPSSLLLGHLKVFDDLVKRGSQDRHPGKSHLSKVEEKV